MNLLTETADGLLALTADEARLRIAQLEDMASRADPFTRKRLLREAGALRPVAEPEHAFDEWTA